MGDIADIDLKKNKKYLFNLRKQTVKNRYFHKQILQKLDFFP